LGVSQEAQSAGEKAIADYFWQHQETLNLLDNPLEKKQP